MNHPNTMLSLFTLLLIVATISPSRGFSHSSSVQIRHDGATSTNSWSASCSVRAGFKPRSTVVAMVTSQPDQDVDFVVDGSSVGDGASIELEDEISMVGDDEVDVDDDDDDDEFELEGFNIEFDDDEDGPDFDAMMDDDDDDEDDEDDGPAGRNGRWSKLSSNARDATRKRPHVQQHKNMVESKHDKKRRLMMYVKDAQREKKRQARVERPIPFDMRTPLPALVPGSKMRGTVISLTNFGAYVDIGTECDGLLHISQMSKTKFIQHPREIMSPGDEIEVVIGSVNPTRKKLHLSLFEEVEVPEEESIEDDDRIPLDDVNVEDEMWGIIKRVTDFGGYIELGAEVQGFLHFMDHPYFGEVPGAHPSTYMEAGQRVRVWVADVDRELNRIKLTAKRPRDLPGPRRTVYW